ncbi:MAG: ferrous iron transport protein B, partial [Planctomycetes bacterium]|nr:ferrous iron transport protein B [Planctomycetota bacterium]
IEGARVVDVPGTYSLSARSADEEIAIRSVAGVGGEPQPDLVIVVVDATQLSRNLYLALQVQELGVPVVLAVTMTDLCEGEPVDMPGLSRAFGAPAVAISGLTGEGSGELLEAVRKELGVDEGERRFPWELSEALEADVAAVTPSLPEGWGASVEPRSTALALWTLLSLDDEDELEDIPAALREAAGGRTAAPDRDIEREVILARYAHVDRVMTQLKVHSAAQRARTERIDSVLLHPLAGFALFLGMMTVVFQALFTWSGPGIDFVEGAFGGLAALVEGALPSGFFRDLLTEGVIGGVGSVVVFLPQILLLFLFMGILEDSGYMARVAFLMDRVMRAAGLNGRAFVPMMSGFACAIPAILATRTMERHRDRFLTMMVVPLMTCGARLPVYTLIIGALFPVDDWLGLPTQGLLMAGMYLFSTLIALVAAAVLSKTLFTGPSVPLLLELPPYRRPKLSAALRMMWQRSALFLKEASGVILACTIGLWLMLSFPAEAPNAQAFASQRVQAEATLSGEELETALVDIDNRESADQLQGSYAGRLGKAIEPVIRPLGYDWKIGVGLIGAFAAREVFVSTMGLVYGLSDEVDEETSTLRDKLLTERHEDGRLVYTPLVGLSLLVFIALACQCMSTLAAVRRETGTYRWPLFMFAYMTALAWGASFVVYQGGLLLGFS